MRTSHSLFGIVFVLALGYSNAGTITSFGGATRTLSLETGKATAAAGDLVVWFTPATQIAAGGTINIEAGTAIAAAIANTVCTIKCNDGADTIPLSDTAAETKWTSTTVLLLTTKTTICVASKVVQITCPLAQLAANPGAGNMQFKVKTSADTTYSALATGYTVVAAASPTWTSALPNTLCATSTPSSLVLKFKPNTEVAAAGTLKLTADKEIFAADAATTCTAKEISTATGVATAVTVTSAVVTGTKKILTVTSAAKLAVLGHEVEVTCTSNLAPITAKDDVVKFSLETSGDTTAITAQTGYTAIAACPVAVGGNSTNNTGTSSSSSNTLTSYTQVEQKYTFPSITSTQYIDNTKGNIECAYTNTVEKGDATDAPTWCVATSGSRTYKTGIITTSVAARRSAAVTFTLKVGTTVMSASSLSTIVFANSKATNFNAKLSAVNTATGFNITSPGTPVVEKAVITSVGSGASSLLPSMLGLVSALYIAFKHM